MLLGALVILIGGAALYVGLFFDANHYKPQIEAAVAKASGMTLTIGGDLSLKVFPRVHLAVKDIHLSKSKSEILAAQDLEVTPELFPFVLHNKIIIDNVTLLDPRIHVEKSASGRMNFEPTQQAGTAGPYKVTKAGAEEQTEAAPGEIHSIQIKNGDISFADQSKGQNIQVNGLDVNLSNISWNQVDPMKSLTFHGDVDAKSVQLKSKTDVKTASNLKLGLRDDRGLIHLDPTEVGIFGGTINGNAKLDLRGSVPKIELAQTASNIDLDQAAPKMKGKISGTVDADVKLTGSGKDVAALTKTLTGTVLVHSKDIKTQVNVDTVASKLNTLKNLDLTSVASVAGKVMGQQAGIAGGTGNPSQPGSPIRILVADLDVHQGIATTKDVAIATEKTTVAFKGDLNLVDQKYQNFYVATVDDKGCSKQKVEIGGPLDSPKPILGSAGKQIAESYLGSAVGSAESKLGGLFGGNKAQPKSNAPAEKKAGVCDQFYSGSALHTG